MPPIIYIEKTDSTNSCLKQLLQDEKPEEGTVLVTNHQTAGRGQRGNSWEAEKGKNLTFSMVLYPHFIPIDKQFILSQLVSLAIKDVLSEYTSEITIKWPNDIYWQEKKIVGILIENTLSENGLENSILGVGINVNQKVFISDAPNPISLNQITGKEYDLRSLLETIQNKILYYYEKVRSGYSNTVIEDYKRNLFRKDGYYLYNDREKDFLAKIKDIQLTGHLILETESGEERTFAFKEVKYVLE